MRLEKIGSKNGCTAFAVEIPNRAGGWGNGYVSIPKAHPLHGKNYAFVDCELPKSNFERELSYSGGIPSQDVEGSSYVDDWFFGFHSDYEWCYDPNYPKDEQVKIIEIAKAQNTEECIKRDTLLLLEVLAGFGK